MKNKYFLLLLIAMLTFSLTGCGQGGKQNSQTSGTESSEAGGEVSKIKESDPVVRIEMENGSVIRIELFPDDAPITVENFLKLTKEGFYDGIFFHRVETNFVVQGGDPQGNGYGGPGYGIKGEFKANGVENNIHHGDGVVSMAREARNYDSAGSQFFICLGEQSFLDGQYAAFGQVIEGMDVVRTIKVGDVMKKVSVEE